MEWALLEPLEHAERAELESRLRRRRFRRGQVVFNEGEVGDALYLIESGRFDVQAATPQGHVVVLRVLHPGEFFGELALVHPDLARTGRISALEAAETLALSRRDFDELRDRHPRLDRMLVAALADRLKRTSDLVVELLMPAEVRLWRRLCVLDEAYGPGNTIAMSQDDLARIAGSVRQTVNRLLKRAEADGVLAIERGAVRVLDRRALEQMSGEG